MEEVEVVDQEISKYGTKGEITPKQIILNHINRISKYIFSGEQEPTAKEKVLTTDRRQVIIQAIEFLTAMLDYHYDSDMNSKQKEFDVKMTKFEKDLITGSISDKALKVAKKQRGDFNRNYFQNKKFYMENKIFLIDKTSGNYEIYMQRIFKLNMDLFKEQTHLLNRIDWLSSETYTE